MAKKISNIKSILTPNQAKFLKLVSESGSLTKKFYLTGGTALSEFYLHHRDSEDIDLFSEEEFNLAPIRSFIKGTEKEMKAESVEFREFLGLKTFFLKFKNGATLKIDFNYYPFPRIEKGARFGKLEVDSIFDIAVNKIHTISMKPRARDFVDIFFIIKEKGYPLKDLVMAAKAKFDWHIDALHLGSRFLLARSLSDTPRMLKKINTEEMERFFIEEAKKLSKEIFK